MAFKRNWNEKLKIAKRAGLPEDANSVRLLNSVSGKNLRRRKV